MAQSSFWQRGWATLAAEWRRGLNDLQNAVMNPWNGQVATHEEPGTIANPTQQIVTEEMGSSYEDTVKISASRVKAPREERGHER